MTDRQCPSCGGFCKKSGCERLSLITQPEVLHLAEQLEIGDIHENAWKAASKLRRLHDKNELLIAANKDSVDNFNVLMADHKKLHEVNRELMKAIAKGLDLPFDNEIAWFEWRDSAEAALAKATGESNA